jgi:hypothetical protein
MRHIFPGKTDMDLIREYFYYLDFAIGAAVPLTVIVLYASKIISPFTWKMFWIGTAIGLMWEMPLSTLDGLGIVDIFRFATPPPAHFIVIIISHTFWDGGLFLAGLIVVKLLRPEPLFGTFRAGELAVLMAWGQIQELSVELMSTGSGGWEYIPAWWNPSLFLFNGRHITLTPQVIWLAAPVVFYFAALAVKKRGTEPPRTAP